MEHRVELACWSAWSLKFLYFLTEKIITFCILHNGWICLHGALD